MTSPLGWSADDCIEAIRSFTPTTRQTAMAWVAASNARHGTPGLAISSWDRERIQTLAAYLHEIDPAREAGALQLAALKLTEVQQVAAAAIAEHLDIEWPVDEVWADQFAVEQRDTILALVAEHHDRLAEVWADLDRDEAKMRAAVITALGLVDDDTTIDHVLGSLTIDTAGTADNDDEVNWEAIASQQLADLYQMRDDIIGRAGDIDRLLSTLADGVQDVIDRIESMIPNEGDTTNE